MLRQVTCEKHRRNAEQKSVQAAHGGSGVRSVVTTTQSNMSAGSTAAALIAVGSDSGSILNPTFFALNRMLAGKTFSDG